MSESPYYRAELTLMPTREQPRRLLIQLSRVNDHLTASLFARNHAALGHGSASLAQCYLCLNKAGDASYLSLGGACFYLSRQEFQKIRALFEPLGLCIWQSTLQSVADQEAP